MSQCPDCEVEEGQTHELYCEFEWCPFCAGQLSSCDCAYTILGLFDQTKYDESSSYLPPEIYSDGLTDELEDKWIEILKGKGRVPYIEYPNVCAKCGCLYPDLFRVPDEEWKKYIQIDMRDSILCDNCYDYIKRVIDQNAGDV